MERAAMERAAIDRAASCALSRRTHEQVSSHCGRYMKRGRSLGFKVTGGGGRHTAQPQAWRTPRGRLSAAALSRMAMKSMNAVLTAAVGSELVSSLQGTLLQLK